MQRYEVDWSKDDDIRAFVEDRWKSKDYYKLNLERKWLEIIAVYEGLPYLSYSQLYKRLTAIEDVPSWRVRLVVNLLLPYIRTAAAKHLRNKPIWDVLPATDATEDIAVALAGKKVLQGCWYTHNLNYKFIELLLWLGLTGNAFAYAYWNPEAGPTMQLSVKEFIDTQQLYAASSNPQALQQIVAQAQQKFEAFVKQNQSPFMQMGDVALHIPTPFDIVVPWTDCWENKPWLISAQMRDISFYVDKGYDPKDFKEPGPSENRFYYYTKRINNLMSLGYGSPDGSSTDPDKQVLELQIWLPKSKQLPQGFWGVIAGGNVLQKGPNPYQHGEIPIIKFTAERTPGKVWGFSAAEQVVPIIREYQKTISQTIEIKNLMAKPKWMVPKSANIKKTAITSEPGELIEYTGAQAPTPHNPPNVPNYMLNLLGIHRKDMDDIMAQRDATKGENPAGSRSATMLVNLQEQDDGQLALIGLDFDAGFSNLGRLFLSNYDQFVREDRLISYTGENNRFEVAALKQGALKGKNSGILGADYYNVRVTQFSQFGLSRAGQMELIKTLLQYNVFKPEDRSKIMKFLSLGFFEDSIDEYKIDRSNAYRENLMMAQGQMAAINLADHHTTHKEEHMRYMKGDDYKQLQPQLQQLFQQHLQDTKLMEIEAAVEPQVLAIKAQILAANLNGVPLQMLGAANGGQPNNGTSSGQPKPSGGASEGGNTPKGDNQSARS